MLVSSHIIYLFHLYWDLFCIKFGFSRLPLFILTFPSTPFPLYEKELSITFRTETQPITEKYYSRVVLSVISTLNSPIPLGYSEVCLAVKDTRITGQHVTYDHNEAFFELLD